MNLIITQGFADSTFTYPYAHVQLDEALKVERVLPGAQLADLLQTRIPVGINTPATRSQFFMKAVADVLELPAVSKKLNH